MRPQLLRAALCTASALLAASVAVPVAAAAPAPVRDGGGAIVAPPRTQISFVHTPSGLRVGTGNQHESRPGLSIVKLYIAEYVLAHGHPSDHGAALQMLRDSSDATASNLYRKYPHSISTTAREFGLGDTRAAAHWGNSTTSTADSVKYLEAEKRAEPNSPILRALSQSQPIAADGYAQNYGTHVLPGVVGTKFGWSDDRRSVHATASFGHDFSVAAATYGDAAQLTSDVRGAFAGEMPAGPEGAVSSEALVAYPARAAASRAATDAVTGSAGSVGAPQAQVDDAMRALAPALQAIPEQVHVPALVRDALPR